MEEDKVGGNGMFCKTCARQIGENRICPYCGTVQWNLEEETIEFSKEHHPQMELSPKNRMTAGILQLFLGMFGVGRFYLGYQKQGIFHILATLATCGLGGLLWGVIDGFLIIDGKIPYDGEGRRLC